MYVTEQVITKPHPCGGVFSTLKSRRLYPKQGHKNAK
nr:MAG TPA: protein of unknown function (DUF951) [Bacteriophage sp.]